MVSLTVWRVSYARRKSSGNRDLKMLSREQQLIQDVFAPLAVDSPGAFGLRDDAALLTCEPDTDLVITKDALVENVHFYADDPPDLIARKALRVNLSDLAAKGAEPRHYLLSLALSDRCDREWIERFAEGLAQDQKAYGCSLMGGDTVASRGGVCISVTAVGSVPKGEMKRRHGAQAGHLIYVSGTVGDSLLGLKVRGGEQFHGPSTARDRDFLADRYLLPQPRVDFVPAIRRHTSSAMDVSDGLVGDLELLCAASGMSAEVDLTEVALSEAARSILDGGLITLEELVTGGDDYELLFTVPPNSVYALEGAARRLSASVSRIGRVVQGNDAPSFFGVDGVPMTFDKPSYSHLE